ncbi:MAG: hypothetical protein ACXWQO_04030 [Bdellovibrionota bacterium]
MKKLNFYLMLFCLFFVPFAQARDGSFTGNGADRKGPGHGAAWFLGDRVVHWCGNNAAIAPALESAVSKWKTYIEIKKIQESLRAPLPFALHFEKQSTCAGADLEIELSADAQADVLSGSELLEQDLARGWGKGRIWLNEKVLEQPGSLETQLLHQLGHILGNDHVGGTVMTESIANMAAILPVRLEIDGSRELYLCRSCAVSWKGTGDKTYQEEKNQTLVAGFKLQFTADLASANHGDANLFTVAVNNWQGHLTSQSLARLGVLDLNGHNEQVIVRRNFDKLLEIHRLNSGKPELFFEVIGQ